ncbi:MAG: DUF4921 family protein [Planctomycetota bacterium]
MSTRAEHSDNRSPTANHMVDVVEKLAAALDASLPVQDHRLPPPSTSVPEPETHPDIDAAPIDQDTRLSTEDETTAIRRARSAERQANSRIGRTKAKSKRERRKPVYRGEEKTSHARRDVMSGAWTIFAPARDHRPNEFAGLVSLQQTVEQSHPKPSSEIDPECPFCSGAEFQTPSAVWSAKAVEEVDGTSGSPSMKRLAGTQASIVFAEQPDWDIRVIPNKFPAVSQFEDVAAAKADAEPLFPLADVVGGHEVVIECGTHAKSLTDMSASCVFLTLLAYRDRLKHWAHVPGVRFISVFKNCGIEAGASLRHTHSQIIATSLIPQAVRSELLRCQMHRARTGSSLGCDLLRAELEERSRIIDQSDSFVAFCPFASRFPGMIRVTSTSHQPHFHAFENDTLDRLGSFLWRVIHWIEECYPGKSYNYILKSCPPGTEQPEAFQWSFEIFPRISKQAGFEWSSDCMINSLMPEKAAFAYREIASRDDPRNVLAFG